MDLPTICGALAEISVLLRKRDRLRRLAAISRIRVMNHRKRAIRLMALFKARSLKKRMRSTWTQTRNTNYWEAIVPQFSDEKFKETFRIDRRLFAIICEKFSFMKKNNTSMRRAIALEKRVAISLYAIGNPERFKEVAEIFGVGRTTVGELTRAFCEAVCNRMEKDYITGYPPTEQSISEITKGFEKLGGLPQCYGAVDGCYFDIITKKDQPNFQNKKTWGTVILLAAADHKSCFTALDVKSAYEDDVLSIFESSFIPDLHTTDDTFLSNAKLIEGVRIPVLLVGDFKFKESKTLLKPYPFVVDISKSEISFNEKLFQCRSAIDSAFDRLRSRFRKLTQSLDIRSEYSSVLIKACCVLHNFCEKNNDTVCESWLDNVPAQPEREIKFNTDVDEDALEIRRSIKTYLSKL